MFSTGAFFPADVKKTKVFSAELFVRSNYLFGRTIILSVKTNVSVEHLHIFRNQCSSSFLKLFAISDISDHMKYLLFHFTNTTITCIIQSSFYMGHSGSYEIFFPLLSMLLMGYWDTFPFDFDVVDWLLKVTFILERFWRFMETILLMWDNIVLAI